MRRVRGVVHGPAWGLSAPQKGGRPAREATLYRAATPRPFLLPLFTQLRGVRILRTSQVRSSRKLTTAFVTMFESVSGARNARRSRGTAGTHGFEACIHRFHQDFHAVRFVQTSRRV